MNLTRTAAPSQPVGVSAVADYGINRLWSEESGSLADRTSEVTGGAGVVVFGDDEDYI